MRTDRDYARWTDEEEAILRACYPRDGAIKVGLRLDRSAFSVKHKANHLGLHRAEFSKGVPWSDAEKAVVKARYTTTSRKEMAKLLPGRTLGAITYQASLLGVRRNVVIAQPRQERLVKAVPKAEPMPKRARRKPSANPLIAKWERIIDRYLRKHPQEKVYQL